MAVIEELVEVFLVNNEEVSGLYNRVINEVVTSEPKEMSNDLVAIPRISSSEAYDLMVQFAKEQEGSAAEQLLELLKEKKPFHEFKSQLHTLELGDEWYEYENDYAKKVMTNWLRENQ